MSCFVRWWVPLAMGFAAGCTGDTTPPPVTTPSEATADTGPATDTGTPNTKKTPTTKKKTDPCPDDVAEDNDIADDAGPVLVKTELNVDDTDPDFFSISVPADQILTVDVLFSDALGDIDIELTAAKAMKPGVSDTDGEQVVWTNRTELTVDAVLQVASSTPEACIPYTVETTLEDAPCLPIKGAKRVFLTAKEYDGDLESPLSANSGLEGADALCQLHADMAKLGGTWTAWLSDSTDDAIDRIADVGPWYLPDQCTQMFASKAAITFSGAETPFNVDEEGVEIHPAKASFWSGTDRDGHSNGFHCTNWTNDSFVGLEGGRGSPYFDWDHTDYWTDFVTNPCDLAHSLLCMEQ